MIHNGEYGQAIPLIAPKATARFDQLRMFPIETPCPVWEMCKHARQDTARLDRPPPKALPSCDQTETPHIPAHKISTHTPFYMFFFVFDDFVTHNRDEEKTCFW
jgi:hypothetical protein